MHRRSLSDYSLSRNSLGSPPAAESTNFVDDANVTKSSPKFPWGGKLTPKRKASSPLQNSRIIHKANSSNTLNILKKKDPHVYIDTQSRGLVSRIVKYHDTAEKRSLKSAYTRPGDFPIVNLKKTQNGPPPKSTGLTKSHSVIIAPPDKSVYQMNARYSVLATSDPPAKSVLDALAEISRKRINNEEQIIESVKKTCSEPLQFEKTLSADVTDRPAVIMKKRQWDNSTSNLAMESIIPESKRDCNRITSVIPTRNNELYSSLSSSTTINKRPSPDTSKLKGHFLHSSIIERPPIHPIQIQAKPRPSISCPIIEPRRHENEMLITPTLSALKPAPVLSTISEPPLIKPTIQPQKTMRLFNANYRRPEPIDPEPGTNEEEDSGINFITPKPYNPECDNPNSSNEKKYENRLKMMFSVIRADEDDDGLTLGKDVVDKGNDSKSQPSTTPISENLIPSTVITTTSTSTITIQLPTTISNSITTFAPIVTPTSSSATTVATTAIPKSTTDTASLRSGGFEFKASSVETKSTSNMKISAGDNSSLITKSNIAPSTATSIASPSIIKETTPVVITNTISSQLTTPSISNPLAGLPSTSSVISFGTSSSSLSPITKAPTSVSSTASSPLNMTFGGIKIPQASSTLDVATSKPDIPKSTTSFSLGIGKTNIITSNSTPSTTLATSNAGGFKFGVGTVTPSVAVSSPASATSSPASATSSAFDLSNPKPVDSKLSTSSTSNKSAFNFGSQNLVPPTSSQPSNLFGAVSSAPSFSSAPTNIINSSSKLESSKETPTLHTNPVVSSAFGIKPMNAPGNIFGSTSEKPVFGGISALSSGFGNVNKTSTSSFGTSTTTLSFGTASTTQSFGTTTTTSTQSFGTITSTTKSINFGATITTSTLAPTVNSNTASPTFGGNTNILTKFGTDQKATPAFGASTTSTTQQQSTPIFGAQINPTASSNLFGGAANKTEVTPNIFGSAVSNSAPASNLFGGNTNTNTFSGSSKPESTFTFKTTQQNASQPQPSDSGMFKFGNTTSNTTSPTFGSNATPNVTQSFGVTSPPAQQSSTFTFGGATMAKPTSGTTSIFGGGASNSTAQSSAFTFGTSGNTNPPQFGPTTNTSAPAFGPTTNTSAPAFGTSTSSFGSTNNNNTPAFGSQNSNNPPAFGSLNSNAPTFGSTTSNSAFGSATNNPQTFGSPTTNQPVFGSGTTNNPAFGPSPTNMFGSTSSNNPPAFGSTATSPFGSNSNNTSTAFGNNNTPAFGANSSVQSTFGNTASNQPALFGATSSTSDAVKPFTFGNAPSTIQTQNQNSGMFNFTNQQPGSTPPGAAFSFGGAPGQSTTAAPTNLFSIGPNSAGSPARRPIRTAARRLK